MDLSATDLLSLLLALSGLAAAVVGVSRSLDARFSKVRSQLTELDQRLSLQLEQLKAAAGVADTRDLTTVEHLEYRINSNTELINHRTNRFCNELARLEDNLKGELAEIKGFLAKTTEFEIRKYDR